MPLALWRTFRYARGWLRDPSDVRASEVELPAQGGVLPATLLRPMGGRAALPAWVVLHGITRPGRAHPTLLRFARALAGSGSAVLIPEVPEWVDLRLAPHRTLPTVLSALDALETLPGVRPAPAGLVGFSFGAPQAFLAAADPRVANRVGVVAGFGGYCDLERTLRFQITGEHEWRGEMRRLRPDPYGRWIVAANYLTRVPGFEDAGAVTGALHRLAARAGEARVQAWDPSYDALKDELAEALSPDEGELFRYFAPPSADDPRPADPRAEEWVARLGAAARRVDPLVDAAARLDAIPVPVHILHGRADTLIPFTESLRMAERLEGRARVSTTVTGLFAHSGEHGGGGLGPRLRERVTFVRALGRLLRAI